MRGMRQLCAGAGVGLILLLGLPATSDAAVSCTFDALSATLRVELGANGDEAEVKRTADDIVVEVPQNVVVPCANAQATVTNTDTVIISQIGPKRGEAVINYLNEENPFAPGASTAGGDSGLMATAEIEFVANMGPGRDRLGFINVIDFVAGDSGVNPNAAPTEVDPDADVSHTGIELLTVDGAGGEDLVDLSGDACCGGPLQKKTTLYGGIDDDIVIGGSRDDRIEGEDGADEIYGGRGDDRIDGGSDADAIVGGPGFDTVLYGFRAAGVTATLGSGLGDDGGSEDGPAGDRDTLGIGLEGLIGTDQDDELRGNARGNFIRGGPGRDSMFGEGGNDRLHARDGESDIVIDCGPGNGDSVRFDPPPQPTDPPPQSC